MLAGFGWRRWREESGELVDETWLQKMNEQFRSGGVEPGRRPWLALAELAKQSGTAVVFPSPEATSIFEWFRTQAPSETGRLGPLLRAVYYADVRFWPLEIPVFFGTCRLEPLASLKTMPESLKGEIASSPSAVSSFVDFWLDCLDYACGHTDYPKGTFGGNLFAGAGAELRSAVSQLLERTPNPRAAQASRMATELHLKSLLAVRAGLTDREARDLGHDLKSALTRCIESFPSLELKFLADGLQRYPAIQDRYDDYQPSREELWICYSIAQRTGAAIVRDVTGVDSRKIER